MAQPQFLRVSGLVVAVGEGVAARRWTCDALEVTTGARLGIVGARGAGKSLFLKALAGRSRTVSGRIDASAPPMLFKPEKLLKGNLQAADALGLLASYYGARRPRAAAKRLLHTLGADGFGSQVVGSMTSSEKATLAYSVALLVRPDILLLDNPSIPPSPRFGSLGVDIVRELIGTADISLVAVNNERQAKKWGVEAVALESIFSEIRRSRE